MPVWMKRAKSPRGLKSADAVAHYIVKRAMKRQFYILPHFEVRAFTWVSQVLPRALKDRLLEKLFPLPNSEN